MSQLTFDEIMNSDSDSITFIPTDNSFSNITVYVSRKPNNVYVRTDLLPDLDHEADNSVEEICGIYSYNNKVRSCWFICLWRCF